MSVILGLKTNKTIIIAGDNKGVSIYGKTQNDLKKVIAVNNNLAFASAGNAVLAKIVEININKSENKSDIAINNLTDIIIKSYNDAKKGIDKLKSPNLCYCIVAGNVNGELKLYCGDTQKEDMTFIETTNIIIPPPDVTIDKANMIYANNYHFHLGKFAEKTVKDIAAISSFVSPSGDMWVYDVVSKKGNLYHFDD